ncbi:MAG: efflux RND transporter periplasmic adaptor subunit [Gemmataceae bacterium]
MIIPPAIVSKIQLRTAAIKRADEPIQLAAFQGALANDNAAMSRIHSRFAGEVVEIGHLNNDVESHSQKSHSRPLQPGDKVKKGQLLAVVWSRDLGQIKSQLVDALTNLKTDEIQLRKAEELYRQNSGPERSVRDAAQKVQSDKNAVATAERALRTARLTDQEIAAVRDEANRLLELNPGKLGVDDWARVELRATQDGTILEMNVSNGLIVDTSTDLFKISDLSHLMIWHMFMRMICGSEPAPLPIQWSVTIPSRSGNERFRLTEQVGPIIDPNQHTALVSGHVENPDGAG